MRRKPEVCWAMTISSESLYMRLGDVVATMPDLRNFTFTPETMAWLGRAYALIAMRGDTADTVGWKRAVDFLGYPGHSSDPVHTMTVILHRALAVAELDAPAIRQGTFIPAGNTFDAMSAVGKVLQGAKRDVLLVDPYLDEKALTDFTALAPEKVALRLLADQQHHKPTLKPAVTRWAAQYGVVRPIEARLTAPRLLHDRLIVVDGAEVWTLTQSFNALAARSPATIVRIDIETAALKVAAYEGMWQAAGPL